MMPYWKGLLKLIAIVYLVWHIGLFFSFFPFWGNSSPIGYGTMIICIVLYHQSVTEAKKEEKSEKKSSEL